MKVPKASLQRVAIAFLVLAAFDLIVGQKTLAMVCAGVAIALGVGAGLITNRSSKTGKRR